MTIHLHALSIGTRGALPLSRVRGIQLCTFGAIAPVAYRVPVAEYRIIAPYRHDKIVVPYRHDKIVVPYRKERVVTEFTRNSTISTTPIYDSVVSRFTLEELVSPYIIHRITLEKE